MKTKTYIYIVCVAVLIGVFVWAIQKEESFVIDPNAPLTKAEDKIETIEIATGENKKEMLQIRFSWESGGIKYNDAIVISRDAYEKMTPRDIEKIKQERFDAWVKTVNTNSNEKN